MMRAVLWAVVVVGVSLGLEGLALAGGAGQTCKTTIWGSTHIPGEGTYSYPVEEECECIMGWTEQADGSCRQSGSFPDNGGGGGNGNGNGNGNGGGGGCQGASCGPQCPADRSPQNTPTGVVCVCNHGEKPDGSCKTKKEKCTEAAKKTIKEKGEEERENRAFCLEVFKEHAQGLCVDGQAPWAGGVPEGQETRQEQICSNVKCPPGAPAWPPRNVNQICVPINCRTEWVDPTGCIKAWTHGMSEQQKATHGDAVNGLNFSILGSGGGVNTNSDLTTTVSGKYNGSEKFCTTVHDIAMREVYAETMATKKVCEGK